MKKNKYTAPRASAEISKDARFPGTYEVVVPIPGRNKPMRVAQQFPNQQAAEAWIHSPDGESLIDDILAKSAK